MEPQNIELHCGVNITPEPIVNILDVVNDDHLRQNDVATSFWCYKDVIIASRGRCV